MASTTNNSGIDGSAKVEDYGPDTKLFYETEQMFALRMHEKELARKREAELRKTRMPPTLG